MLNAVHCHLLYQLELRFMARTDKNELKDFNEFLNIGM